MAGRDSEMHIWEHINKYLRICKHAKDQYTPLRKNKHT